MEDAVILTSQPPPLPKIDKTIVRALCSLQKTVDAVSKSQFNKHGGYKFASADDIYAAVTRKLGEVGLVILPLQLRPAEIKRIEVDVLDREGKPTGAKKTQQWGSFEFGFALATDEATWFDPRSSQSLFLQLTGPQSHNAAASYAQKTYLRALLKIPTGDQDLDAMPEADTEEDQVLLGNGRAKRKSSAEGKRDGSVKTFNEINAKIREAKSADLCKQTWQLYAEELKSMPPKWFSTLAEDFQTRMAEFDVEIDLDNDGWPVIDTQQEAA